MARAYDKIRHKGQRAFLVAYVETGNVSAASRAASIARDSHYRWLEASPAYAEAFADAEVAATEMLEGEARRRAVDGVTRPVWYQGKHVGDEIVYSDQLLALLLKAGKPEKYRERIDARLGGELEHKGAATVITDPVAAAAAIQLQERLAQLEEEHDDADRPGAARPA